VPITVSVVDNVLKVLPKLVGVRTTFRLPFRRPISLIRQTIASGTGGDARRTARYDGHHDIPAEYSWNVDHYCRYPLSILITFIMFRFGNITEHHEFGGLALAVAGLLMIRSSSSSHFSHYNERKKDSQKSAPWRRQAKLLTDLCFDADHCHRFFFHRILERRREVDVIQLTITIAVALFGSFFVSRTVTPLMCLNLFPPENPRPLVEEVFRPRTCEGSWHGQLLDDWYENGYAGHLARKPIIIRLS